MCVLSLARASHAAVSTAAAPRCARVHAHSEAFEDQLFEAILWSDPRPIQGRQLSARGAGVEFGQASPRSTALLAAGAEFKC
jgi:hypothetical protein